MSLEDPGSVSFAGIGGLGEQVRELREIIELPLMNPELFEVSFKSSGEVHNRPRLILTASGNQTSKGCFALRSTRNRENSPGKSGSCDTRHEFLEGGLFRCTS